ncbi:LysR family transcriptional regulator, partial [Mesorhizobium sp. M00.F.Ca.ET.038.03.1.1]
MQAFEAVGRSGSVAIAARDLGLTPGAVSQHIGRLEEE